MVTERIRPGAFEGHPSREELTSLDRTPTTVPNAVTAPMAIEADTYHLAWEINRALDDSGDGTRDPASDDDSPLSLPL